MTSAVLQFYIRCDQHVLCIIQGNTRYWHYYVNWLFVVGDLNVTHTRVSMLVLHNIQYFAQQLLYLIFYKSGSENSPSIWYAYLFEIFYQIRFFIVRTLFVIIINCIQCIGRLWIFIPCGWFGLYKSCFNFTVTSLHIFLQVRNLILQFY
jgi:hypothetical protein